MVTVSDTKVGWRVTVRTALRLVLWNRAEMVALVFAL